MSRIKIDERANFLSIKVPCRIVWTHVFLNLFVLLIWGVAQIKIVFDILPDLVMDPSRLTVNVVAIFVFSALVGAALLFELMSYFFGYEQIEINENELLCRTILFWPIRNRRYELVEVQEFGMISGPVPGPSFLARYLALFFAPGLSFDHREKTHYAGYGIDRAEARLIVDAVKKHAPSVLSAHESR